MGKLLGGLIAILGALVVFVLLSLLFIKIGWALFMTPVFGLAELTWGQALGFSLLAATFRGSSFKSKES